MKLQVSVASWGLLNQNLTCLPSLHLVQKYLILQMVRLGRGHGVTALSTTLLVFYAHLPYLRGANRRLSRVTKQQLFPMLTQSRCWTSGPDERGSCQASKHPLPSLTTSWPGGLPCSLSGPSELRNEKGKTECSRDNYFQGHW